MHCPSEQDVCIKLIWGEKDLSCYWSAPPFVIQSHTSKLPKGDLGAWPRRGDPGSFGNKPAVCDADGMLDHTDRSKSFAFLLSTVIPLFSAWAQHKTLRCWSRQLIIAKPLSCYDHVFRGSCWSSAVLAEWLDCCFDCRTWSMIWTLIKAHYNSHCPHSSQPFFSPSCLSGTFECCS